MGREVRYQVREATAAQHGEWKQSRDLAISDGEIDLDAGNNPDDWNVCLTGAPRTNKVRPKKSHGGVALVLLPSNFRQFRALRHENRDCDARVG